MPVITDSEYLSFLDTLQPIQKESLTHYLETFVSDNKRGQMHQVLDHRTRHVAVVLENIYQPHNAAATVRSCECFGFQDLHIIEAKTKHVINRNVTMGGCKWVSMHHHKKDLGGTKSILQRIKASGYKIAATSMRPGCVPLEELDLSEPVALCFGTEEKGLSEEAHEMADVFVQIPSFGFTQSFNVSVSVALSLTSIRNRLEKSKLPWQLPPEDRHNLYLTWLMKTANRGLVVARNYLARE
ncbi:MAG: RNA methyltransferase [Verrucomicrobia bacterium]|nr:RNA methyltransferase [Verrucomicrobiota bacterium]MDA1067382.1 RNA methyltransferase [Verrucomicrobiota bacterium]